MVMARRRRGAEVAPFLSAGLIRFGEDESRVRLKPIHVVIISAVFMGLVVLANLLA